MASPQGPPTATPTADRPTTDCQPPSAANRHQLPTIVQYCFCGFVSCPCLEEAESVPVNVRFYWRYEPSFTPP